MKKSIIVPASILLCLFVVYILTKNTSREFILERVLFGRQTNIEPPKKYGMKTVFNKSNEGMKFHIQPKNAPPLNFFLPSKSSRQITFEGNDQIPQLESIMAINPETRSEIFRITEANRLLNSSHEIAFYSSGFKLPNMIVENNAPQKKSKRKQARNVIQKISA